MKQNITTEQLNELSQDAKEKLYIALFPDMIEDENRKIVGFRQIIDINPEYLDIGRLIEFLDENIVNSNIDICQHKPYDDGWFWSVTTKIENKDTESPELCDALWEACKEILNK
jgi:hypothetical protein